MTYPPVQVVDENDKIIGAAQLDDVWQTGQIHRIVRIMVEDEAGRILLQKRSAHVGLFPLCWDHSAAGHVDEGDSYESAARRELKEELGLAGVPLSEIAYYRTDHTVNGRRLNRFNKLYKAVVKADRTITIDEHEVAEARWFTRKDVKQLVAEYPSQVTDGLIQVMQEYY